MHKHSVKKVSQTPGRSRQDIRNMERRHPLERARRGKRCIKYTSKAGVTDFIAMASKHV